MENLNAKARDVLGGLFFRWRDEKKYEDWADYETAIRGAVCAAVPEGAEVVKVSKRPFGATLAVPRHPYLLRIRVTPKGTQVEETSLILT